MVWFVTNNYLFLYYYLTTFFVANIIVWQMLSWFLNENLVHLQETSLVQFQLNILYSQEEPCKIFVNVSVVQIVIPMLALHRWTLYLLKQLFRSLRLGPVVWLNEINIILNTFVYLMGFVFILSDWATCFGVNYEFFIF